jgi:multicomponent K+:H+ antiporter subunit E
MSAPSRAVRSARLLPQPLLSLLLLLVWVLAFNRLTPGVVLLGLGLAVAVPIGTARFWPEYPRRVRYRAAVRFAGTFLWDVLVANVRVAALVLGPTRRLRPTFFAVPLDVEQPYVTALLAAVVSLTPGTVSADYDPSTRTLLVHGLDVTDPAAEAARIKARYERALLEVFPA